MQRSQLSFTREAQPPTYVRGRTVVIEADQSYHRVAAAHNPWRVLCWGRSLRSACPVAA
jgi:hypothetical protein